MSKNYHQSGYNNVCNYYPPNCETVLEPFHNSIMHAFELFAESGTLEAEALEEKVTCRFDRSEKLKELNPFN